MPIENLFFLPRRITGIVVIPDNCCVLVTIQQWTSLIVQYSLQICSRFQYNAALGIFVIVSSLWMLFFWLVSLLFVTRRFLGLFSFFITILFNFISNLVTWISFLRWRMGEEYTKIIEISLTCLFFCLHFLNFIHWSIQITTDPSQQRSPL